MRRDLLLALPLFLGLAQAEARAENTAACDLSALPDPATAYSEGKLRVTQAADAATGGATLRLTAAPVCGHVLRIVPANAQAREEIFAQIPAIAAEVLRATAPLTVMANQILNGIPLEAWSGGTDEFFLITAQQLDGDRPYSPDRGTLCIGVTRLPVVYRPELKTTLRAVEWARVMERLASVCMKDVPRDTASSAVAATLNGMVNDMEAMGKGRAPALPVGAIAGPATRARLNPRPAGWPALDRKGE